MLGLVRDCSCSSMFVDMCVRVNHQSREKAWRSFIHFLRSAKR